MLDIAIQCTDKLTGVKGTFIFDSDLGLKAIGQVYPSLVDLLDSSEYKEGKRC